MRATDLLLLCFLSVHLLSSVFCQEFCAPRAVVSSVVRATVFRTGPAGGQSLPNFCDSSYDEFRIELEYVAVKSMELAEGCSVVSSPVGHECRASGQCIAVASYHVYISTDLQHPQGEQ